MRKQHPALCSEYVKLWSSQEADEQNEANTMKLELHRGEGNGARRGKSDLSMSVTNTIQGKQGNVSNFA